MTLVPGGSIHSREYALFNEGAYLALAGLFGYILAPPSAPTRQALAGPLSVVPDVAWGLLFVLVGLAAVTGAYWPRAARAGKGAVLAVSWAWSTILLVGVAVFLIRNHDAIEISVVHSSLPIPYVDIVPGMARDVVARGLFSALIFGGVASHVSRIILPRRHDQHDQHDEHGRAVL